MKISNATTREIHMSNFNPLVLSLLALTAFSADKPAYTDPALSTYNKSIEDIDSNAIKAKREARNKAVVALDVAIKKAMAASDLDKAVWLKGEKDRIAKEWVPSDGEFFGDKPVKIEDAIVGKWKQEPNGDIFIFSRNSTLTHATEEKWSGKWSISKTNDVIITTHNLGIILTWKLMKDGSLKRDGENFQLMKIQKNN
jgi:hypothetical protein